MHFNDIDLNKDLQLDLNEAIKHIEKTRGRVMQFFYTSETPAWFNVMDRLIQILSKPEVATYSDDFDFVCRDGDRIISPREFDDQLDIPHIRHMYRHFYNHD